MKGSSPRIKKFLPSKAQIEVSFNWIFVLIAGAVILGFFIAVTKAENKGSNMQYSRQITSKMDTLLGAIQQNPDSVQKHDSINAELTFSCNAITERHTYSLAGSNFESDLESQVIFTPKVVGGTQTIAWTQLYASPYPIVYVLYFTDEKTKYVFLDSGNSKVKELYMKMPALFQKSLVTQAELQTMKGDDGYRQYIIITDVGAPSITLTSSMKEKSSMVRINSGQTIQSVAFIDVKTGNIQSTFYTNDVALYGAIISGDADLYRCAMVEIMDISKIVGHINLERITAIQNERNLEDDCADIFMLGNAQTYINEIIDNSEYAQSVDYPALLSAATSLDNFNRNLARANCPTIY